MASLNTGKFYSKSGENKTVTVESRTIKTNNIKFINKDVSVNKLCDIFETESEQYCVFGQTNELFRNIEFEKTYTVTFGNSIHNCVCRKFEDYLCIGNTHIIIDTEIDTGEPFVYFKSYKTFGDDLWVLMEAPASVEHDPEALVHIEVVGDAQLAHKIQNNILPNGNTSDGEAYKSSKSGQQTFTYGAYSQADGWNTKTTGSAVGASAEGIGTVATTVAQHVEGRNNLLDVEHKHAHIIGNGTGESRSNAMTVDFDGTGWFSGDVYVKSTSGTDKDDGSLKLATEKYVDEHSSVMPEYIKRAAVSNEGNTLTLTKKDDTTVAFSPQNGKIDKIRVNGTEQPITNKTVNITIPTDVSALSDNQKILVHPDGVSENMTQPVGKDSSGKLWTTPGGEISTSYIKDATVSGDILTLIKKDDSTITYHPTGGTSGVITVMLTAHGSEGIPSRYKGIDILDYPPETIQTQTTYEEVSQWIQDGYEVVVNFSTDSSQDMVSARLMGYSDEGFVFGITEPIMDGWSMVSIAISLSKESGWHVQEIFERHPFSVVDRDNETMTQEVGIDEDGSLWTKPGSEPSQYIKSATVSGNKLSLLNKDGTTTTFEPQGGSEPSQYLKQAWVDGNTLKITDKDGWLTTFSPQGTIDYEPGYYVE